MRITTVHLLTSLATRLASLLPTVLRRQLQLSAKLRRRLAEDLLENAIKVCERLEPHFVSDFADAQICVSQELTRVFEAYARNVLHEIYARNLLKFFAQMIRADVDCLRHLLERKFLA